MKKFEVIFEEYNTCKVLVVAKNKEEAQEQIETEYPDEFEVVKSSWEVTDIKESVI